MMNFLFCVCEQTNLYRHACFTLRLEVVAQLKTLQLDSFTICLLLLLLLFYSISIGLRNVTPAPKKKLLAKLTIQFHSIGESSVMRIY